MKAEAEQLIDLMFDNKRQYQIPVYQRNYDWGKDSCLELFNDVMNAYEKSHIHFLGTIVQVQQMEECGLKHFVIVDGQQRMTSIYLLLKALYDKTLDESTKEELNDLLFNSSSSHDFDKYDKNKLKLKPIKSDNEQFVLLMTDNIQKMDKTSNIYINYDYFCKLIDEKLSNDYKTKNILSGLKKLQIVMISLKEPEDDPQVIFERINSTGEALKLADLVRNYLLMTDINMDNLFEEYWLPMETLLGKEEINKYFITYFIFKLGDVKEDSAYQLFKKWADESGLSHEEIIKELQYYSKFYAAFVGLKNDYSDDINNYLSAFRSLKQSTIYPFLFNIFADFDSQNLNITEDDLLEILKFFINYTIRRLIVGVPSNSLRGLYRTLYKRIFKEEGNKEHYVESIYNFMAKDLAYTKDSTPNDTLFKEKLISENIYKNRNLCKYILSILENGISGIKEVVKIDNETTIEHIMPQNKENEDWRSMIGSNFELVYDKYLHTLGNLSLTGYNSELSDKKFSEKVQMIAEKSKFTYLNQDVINQSVWNAETIAKRADRLSSKLIRDLQLPSIFGLKISSPIENVHRVDDSVDYAGKKPCYFIILGEKIDVSSAREMYIKVIETLYNLDADKLRQLAISNYKFPGGNNPLITLDKSLLRTSVEIFNSGIYVEVNHSFNTIVKAINYIMEEYGLERDDFIFYTKAES